MDFIYAIDKIPIKLKQAINKISFNDIIDIKHIGNGGNSNIYCGYYKNHRVIVKMIKIELENSELVKNEFNLEYNVLMRLSHSNIVTCYGFGVIPRKFIVLEYLEGRTLADLLEFKIKNSGLYNALFPKPLFSYLEILEHAKSLAEILHYLHTNVYQGACLIHRDLKPDNVGFTKDGKLKLFDFGLVTCVKTRTMSTECYKMTGYTGSLRYMAPEVALKEPYNEKVDVYSYSIILWQMATAQIPFQSYDQNKFIKEVVLDNLRPNLDQYSLPIRFKNLLRNCWHRDSMLRPSFEKILFEIELLHLELNNNNTITATSTIERVSDSIYCFNRYFNCFTFQTNQNCDLVTNLSSKQLLQNSTSTTATNSTSTNNKT